MKRERFSVEKLLRDYEIAHLEALFESRYNAKALSRLLNNRGED